MKMPDQTRAFAIYVFGPSPEGKFYVGQTENITRRFGTHLKANGECPEFHRAVRLFGPGAFPLQIVAETDVAEEADRLESLFITKFNSLIPHGYNLTLGGRAVRFQPGLKVVGFTEHPVSPEEMRRMAQRMADEAPFESLGLIVCPCCGEATNHEFPSCRCGVAPDFSRQLLSAMARGDMLENLPLCEDSKLVKKWRTSRDADFFMHCEKRSVRSRTIATVAPVAMQKYATRFWPYLESAVRRRCLVEKRLPCYRLGTFKPFPGGKTVAMKQIQIEKLLRHTRNELGSSEENIEVFTRILGWQKEQSGKQFDVVISTFLAHGGSESEIREARRRTLLYREIERELPVFRCFTSNLALMQIEGENWSAVFSFASLPMIEEPLRSIIALPHSDRRSALLKLVEFPPPMVMVKRRDHPAPQRESTTEDLTNPLVIHWGNLSLAIAESDPE
jgi:predicted GIY-YIG superfamily endonuclease